MEILHDQFDIDKQRVFSDIGYAADAQPTRRMISLVDEYARNARDLVESLYSYTVKEIVLVQSPHIILEDSVMFESGVISGLLQGCKKVAIFVLTIGSHLEETANHLAEDGLVLQAAVLDAIGSRFTESLADFVQERIREEASVEGLYISRRFSPGYCDWDVSQQQMLFKAMGGEVQGIQLTKGCLMLPKKSVSGVIGIGSASVQDYNPCVSCDRKDCVGRRENQA